MSAHPDRSPRTGSAAVLEPATRTSLYAPSVFNTQPWRWRIIADRTELYADSTRRLDVTDPAGRLLLISCGAVVPIERLEGALR
jgi:hypothetical protein